MAEASTRARPRARPPRAGPCAGVTALSAVSVLGGALAIAIATAARAAAAAEARSADAAPRCTTGERGAIAELGCELARALPGPAGSPPGVVVLAARPTSDRALVREAELAGRLATATANAIGEGARALPGAFTLAEARAAARGAGLLVFVGLEIAGGDVRAVGDTHPAPLGFWDRVRGAKEGPGAHVRSTRPVDGEVASFLPAVPLVTGHIDKVDSPTPDVVALACGDVAGDAAPEIAVVGRHKILLGRVQRGRFVARAEVAWTALGPVAPAPLREPIAHAEIAPGRFLTVGSTDREHAWTLSGTLAPLRALHATMPWGPAGCLVRRGTALGLPTACEGGGKGGMDVGDVPETDAIASGTSVSAAGRARLVVGWRAPSDGTVTLRDDSGRTAHVPGAGGALAIADLDSDGAPELLTSESTSNPEDDALVVRSWSDDGSVRERLRVPVPGGIRAIAACPAEGASMAPIVLATPTALWVVR